MYVCVIYMCFTEGREENKSKKGLPLEAKNTQNHEIRRHGLIESLHMQHCSLRVIAAKSVILSKY